MLGENNSFWERNKERLFTSAFLLLLLYAVIRSSAKAAIRPFWGDELCIWIVSRQPNLQLLWHSLVKAADGQPPPYYLLERFFDKLIPNDHVALRMPSILAFCLMEWCLFVWLKKRYNSFVAFVAALFPFTMVTFSAYAVEARPYCLLAALFSVALMAYERVTTLFWTLILSVSLLAAESVHYYAVFMAIPFFAAEFVFFLKTKSFRWRVWTALSAVILPLLIFWPILSNFKIYYSGHYWNQASLLVAIRSYGWVLGMHQGLAYVFSWPVVAGYLLTATFLIASAFSILQALRANPSLVPFFQGGVLIAGFLLLPFILYVAAKLSGGGYTARYFVPVTIGYVWMVALGLSRLSRNALSLVGVALLVGLTIQESQFWFSYSTLSQLGFAQPKPVEELVKKSGSQLPVVISDDVDFIQMQHYATPPWKQRLNYLADPAAAVAYDRADTGEKELLVLREFAPLRVFTLNDFIASNPKFLLFSDPKPENDPDWKVQRLVADGYSVKTLATDGHDMLYLVESKHAD